MILRVLPVPVVQLYVEHDGSEDERCLQENPLRILGLSTKQRHLSIPSFFTGKIFDLLNELYFICLQERPRERKVGSARGWGTMGDHGSYCKCEIDVLHFETFHSGQHRSTVIHIGIHRFYITSLPHQ